MHHIFLILTIFMPVISSAGPLETLNIQSCHYLCGTSEFTAIIPEERIPNAVLITTEYTGRGVKTFIQKTLNAAYEQLRILDISRYCTSSEFKDVFQRMPSEHITYIIFDSAFTEDNLSSLPLPLIEAIHSLAILKQDKSMSMKNDDSVEKKTTNPLYIFSLCVWNRQENLSFSIQKKEEKIKQITTVFDNMLSSLLQQGDTDLQMRHDQNICDFTPNAQPTLYQHSAPLPAHFMSPPELPFAYFMPPPGPSPTHLMLPSPPSHFMLSPKPLVSSFFQPDYIPPFAAFMQPYAMHVPPQFTEPYASALPYASPVPPQFTVPPPTPLYALPPVPPSLSFAPSQAENELVYPVNAMLDLSAKNTPHSTKKNPLDQTKYPFFQQVYKIGSFEIPIYDSKQMWSQCTKQFGYITFEDYNHASFYFLSNFFSCKIPFSVDDKKTSWASVTAFISAKKLDYFDPPLPEEMKQKIFYELQQYDQENSSHASLEAFKEFKKKVKKQHAFHQKHWKKVSGTLFFHALYCKFNSNPDLKEKLLQTETQMILYKNPMKISHKTRHSVYYQYFWGVDIENCTGYNVLGNLLCLVREYLRNDQTPPPLS